jgi:hypothetical protein
MQFVPTYQPIVDMSTLTVTRPLSTIPLQGLGGTRAVNLGAKVRSSRPRGGEVAGEKWLEEGSEDDLSAAGKVMSGVVRAVNKVTYLN